MTTKNITVTKPTVMSNQGLARLIECANSYKSYLAFCTAEAKINAKSLLGVLALQLSEGMSVELIADGPDELEALEALASHLCA